MYSMSLENKVTMFSFPMKERRSELLRTNELKSVIVSGCPETPIFIIEVICFINTLLDDLNIMFADQFIINHPLSSKFYHIKGY